MVRNLPNCSSWRHIKELLCIGGVQGGAHQRPGAKINAENAVGMLILLLQLLCSSLYTEHTVLQTHCATVSTLGCAALCTHWSAV